MSARSHQPQGAFHLQNQGGGRGPQLVRGDRQKLVARPGRFPQRQAGSGMAQLAVHRCQQADQSALDEEVVSAILQRQHRGVLADGARDDDEGDVQVGALEDRQGRQGAEGRHREIGQHDLPGPFGQRQTHLGRGLHAAMADLVPTGAQVVHQQLGVALRVLDDQGAQQLHQ
jgi:hypothetical protein